MVKSSSNPHKFSTRLISGFIQMESNFNHLLILRKPNQISPTVKSEAGDIFSKNKIILNTLIPLHSYPQFCKRQNIQFGIHTNCSDTTFPLYSHHKWEYPSGHHQKSTISNSNSSKQPQPTSIDPTTNTKKFKYTKRVCSKLP